MTQNIKLDTKNNNFQTNILWLITCWVFFLIYRKSAKKDGYFQVSGKQIVRFKSGKVWSNLPVFTSFFKICRINWNFTGYQGEKSKNHNFIFLIFNFKDDQITSLCEYAYNLIYRVFTNPAMVRTKHCQSLICRGCHRINQIPKRVQITSICDCA